jgi:hypothetical protein
MSDFVRNFVDENSPEVPSNLLTSGAGDTYSIADVTWIQNFMSDNRSELQNSCPGLKHFHELMEKCCVILPEPEIPPRNPELEARCLFYDCPLLSKSFRFKFLSKDFGQILIKKILTKILKYLGIKLVHRFQSTYFSHLF